MSAINVASVHSDIEKKITAWIKANITDRKASARAAEIAGGNKVGPFAVIGTELQHKHYFPHVIIQIIDMPGNLFALNSKSRIKYPVVQLTMYDSNKKNLNITKDEILYEFASARDTWLSWGLSRCKVRSEGWMPYNRELKVHGFFIQYEFLYFHMLS